MDSQNISHLNELFRSQRFAVLATEGQGQPYQSLVGFASSEDMSFFAFATVRHTRKFSNLIANPRVSLMIDDRENADCDFERAVAVTITGRSSVAHDEERSVLSRMLLKKLPRMSSFIQSPDCELIRLTVEQFIVVTNFQTVNTFSPR